jgi:hypothetical protein
VASVVAVASTAGWAAVAASAASAALLLLEPQLLHRLLLVRLLQLSLELLFINLL